jgi:hypothetical protein
LNGKIAAPGLENRDQRPWGSVALAEKVGTNFADNGGRSVGIVRLWTKDTKFSF